MFEHRDGSPEPARAEAPAPAVPMQILGRLEEFDPMTDTVASSQSTAFQKERGWLSF